MGDYFFHLKTSLIAAAMHSSPTLVANLTTNLLLLTSHLLKTCARTENNDNLAERNDKMSEFIIIRSLYM